MTCRATARRTTLALPAPTAVAPTVPREGLARGATRCWIARGGRLCRPGAPVKSFTHSASFHAPAKRPHHKAQGLCT